MREKTSERTTRTRAGGKKLRRPQKEGAAPYREASTSTTALSSRSHLLAIVLLDGRDGTLPRPLSYSFVNHCNRTASTTLVCESLLPHLRLRSHRVRTPTNFGSSSSLSDRSPASPSLRLQVRCLFFRPIFSLTQMRSTIKGIGEESARPPTTPYSLRSTRPARGSFTASAGHLCV